MERLNLLKSDFRCLLEFPVSEWNSVYSISFRIWKFLVLKSCRFFIWSLFRMKGPMLEIIEILAFDWLWSTFKVRMLRFGLVHIWGSNARIEFRIVLLDSEDNVRPRGGLCWFSWGPELDLAFWGVMISFLWLTRDSNQRDIKFVFWWLHCVWNVECSKFAYIYVLCVRGSQWIRGSFWWFEVDWFSNDAWVLCSPHLP